MINPDFLVKGNDYSSRQDFQVDIEIHHMHNTSPRPAAYAAPQLASAQGSVHCARRTGHHPTIG